MESVWLDLYIIFHAPYRSAIINYVMKRIYLGWSSITAKSTFWTSRRDSHFESNTSHPLGIMWPFLYSLTQHSFVIVLAFWSLIGQQQWPRDSVPWAPHFRSSDVLFGADRAAAGHSALSWRCHHCRWKSLHYSNYCSTVVIMIIISLLLAPSGFYMWPTWYGNYSFNTQKIAIYMINQLLVLISLWLFSDMM